MGRVVWLLNKHSVFLVLVVAMVVGELNSVRAEIRLESLHYAAVSENEEAQIVPIPTRINEIIYPTLGFPSMVFRGETFSVILQLDSTQRHILAKNLYGLKVEARLSPYFGRVTERPVPKGFEQYYKHRIDFIDHYASGDRPFRPLFKLKRWHPLRMLYEVTADVESRQLTKEVLMLTVRLPLDLPEYYDRVNDLEVKITLNNETILHDIQRHAVGILKKKDRYRFIHFADPQINNIDYTFNGAKFEKHSDLSQQEQALAQAATEMNFLRPDFAVISGDLVEGGNTYYNPGKFSGLFAGNEMIWDTYFPMSSYHLDKTNYWNEYQSITTFLRLLNFPTFSAPGNHDGYAAYEKQDSFKTVGDIELSDTVVGDEPQRVMFDGKHFWRKMIGPRYFSFDFGQWHFVFVDTFDFRRFFRLSYSNFAANNGGWISQEQLKWIETDFQAAKQSGKKIVIVGHHDPRGGAQGMFFDQTKYRLKKRGVEQLGDELWYNFSHMTTDPLFASQEWAAPHLVDGGYDSAAAFLKLIADYPVSHVFLGHVHANYKDRVRLGNKEVSFVHTTSLSAQAYQARGDERYEPQAGEGEGSNAHWGYRIFEMDFDGEYLDEVSALELGNIRVQAGYDPDYKRVRTFFGEERPIPDWIPFSGLAKQLESEGKLVWPLSAYDPIFLSKMLMHPSFHPWLEGSDMFGDHYESSMWRLYQTLKKEVGEKKRANEFLFANLNDVPLSGWVEMPLYRTIPASIEAELMVEDGAADYPILMKIGSQEIFPEEILLRPGGRWIRFPVDLPAVADEKPVFTSINLNK